MRIYSIRQVLSVFALVCFVVTIYGQQWEEVSETPFLVHHSNGFGTGDVGFVIEGEPVDLNGLLVNRIWEFSSITNEWTNMGEFPGPGRTFAIGDEWDGKYYYGFGVGNDGVDLNDLWVYDPSDASFTELPSCPCVGRAHPALAAHNDKILMGTGSGPDGDLEDWWEYDMISQQWTQKTDMPGGRRHHPFFFESGNTVYVGGGHRTNWLAWDLDTETWSEIDDQLKGRVAGTQLSFGKYGLVIAGDDASHSHVATAETFMGYDTSTDEWIRFPFIPDGSKWACSSLIINEELYFFGGINYAVNDDRRVWKFNLENLDCLPPQNITLTDVTDISASFIMTRASTTISDTVYWRETSTQDWNVIPDPMSIFELSGLTECTEYELFVRTQCDTQTSDSEIISFYSANCGPCVELDYCVPDIDNNAGEDVYITEVVINDYVNVSDNSGGYANYSIPEAQTIESNTTFNLQVNAEEGVFDLDLVVWVDLNIDGAFSIDEQILNTDLTDNFNEDILLPFGVVEGLSRIRIFVGFIPGNTSCYDDNLYLGEVEDYCIVLQEGTSSLDSELDNNKLLEISPNPFQNVLTLKNNSLSEKPIRFVLYNTQGKKVNNGIMESTQMSIDLSDLEKGLYMLNAYIDGHLFSSDKVIKQ